MSRPIYLSVLFVLAGSAWAVTDFSDCPGNMATLESALYDDGRNIVEMNRVFFPPGNPPQFAFVEYKFLNESNEISDCNVIYAWATSTFLIFLPPTIFRWSSLHFFYPENEIQYMRIVLPHECRALVQTSLGDDNCTCNVEDTTLLDLLTRQIGIYAKYNDRGQVTRERSSAQTICSENIETSFYDKEINSVVTTLLFSTLFLPIFAIILVLSLFRNTHDTFTKKLVKPENHANLVAMVMTGLVVTIVVYAHDAIASYHVVNNTEFYRRDISSYTPQFSFIYVILAFDTVFVISLIIIWIYILYHICRPVKFSFPPKLERVVSFVVGKKNVQYLRTLSDNDIIPFSIFYMLVPPIFMTISHIAYIVGAWLVQPQRGTVVLFIAFLFSFYMYIAFKKVYNVHSNMTFSTRPKIPSEAKATTDERHEMITIDHSSSSSESSKFTLIPQPDEAKDDSNDDTKDKTSLKKFKICGRLYLNYGEHSEYLNVQMFTLSLLYGVFIVIFGTMAFSMFVLVPSTSESIAIYIVNIFQIMVILIAVLISVRILFDIEFDIDDFMEVLRDRLSTKKATKANEIVISVAKSEADTNEMAGTLAADMVDAIINRLKDD